jgi:hypothetical protein
MDTQKKLYIAIAVLALLGGGLYMQKNSQRQEAERHSLEGVQAELPQVSISDEQEKKISKVVLTRPHTAEKKAGEADDKAAPSSEGTEEYVLERKGDEAWELSKPLVAKASASNVQSLLDNLKKLKVTEQISTSADAYKDWGLTDDKAIHAVVYEGDKVVADLYFGDSGSRGQMTRIAGKDGVYAVKGFSKFNFDRDAKAWRDRTIFKFDDKNVVKISIENEHGSFLFTKEGEKWAGKHKPASGGELAAIQNFKESGVTSLLSAYKSLNAVDFARDKTPAQAGLDKPTGTVTFELKDGTEKHIVNIGGTAESSNRWAKSNGMEEIFSVSSWTAELVTSDVDKFQEKKEEAKKDEAKDGDHGEKAEEK